MMKFASFMKKKTYWRNGVTALCYIQCLTCFSLWTTDTVLFFVYMDATQFCVMSVTHGFTKGVVAYEVDCRMKLALSVPCVGECRKRGSDMAGPQQI